jgi:kumamolisin
MPVKTQLPGSASNYRQEQGDVVVRAADLDQTISALIILHSKTSETELTRALEHLLREKPASRRYLSIEDFLHEFGAPVRHVEAVLSYSVECGFEVATHGGGLGIEITGTLAQFEDSFEVQFVQVTRAGTTFLTYRNELAVPTHLAPFIEAVLGLETEPTSTHRMRVKKLTAAENRQEMEAIDVARHYLFPDSVDLSGQCIGLLELGGGFHQSDLFAYWNKHHLHDPKLTVASGMNNPAHADVIADYVAGRLDDTQARWTVEVTLDIQLASAFAPGAHLAVYFASDSEKGQYQALLMALTDRRNRPSVLSISWGTAETHVSRRWMHGVNRWLKAAALMGVTVCVASGDLTYDTGAKTYIPPGHDPKTVSFPASSPYVLSCGGSHLPRSEQESVWYELFRGFQCSTIGGVSSLAEEPAWQSRAGIRDKVGGLTGRGVPDVAGKADLTGGYCLFVGGHDITMGGTSAAAPMWAAMIANLNAHLKARLGFVTPLFYTEMLDGATHQIHEGTNGVWHAGPGWNPCTGLGSPKGTHLLKAFREIYPQTVRAGGG